MSIESIDKKKIRADDYLSLLIIISYVGYAMFFRLEALLAIGVYPFVALSVYGFLKILKGLRRKINYGLGNINKILLGIVYIIISLLWLNFLIFRTYAPSQIIISLIAFPVMNAGFGGIVKGIIIDSYSIKHRIINFIVGIITIIICLLAFFYVVNDFIFNIVLLSLILLINILCRAALYLSEYGLSLIHISNFKLFLYIISNYLVFIDRDGNLILKKIET
ncbi:MAG: hypothetical protein ACFE75_01240 [Candidatus Hodarchaeota archaeon]